MNEIDLDIAIENYENILDMKVSMIRRSVLSGQSAYYCQACGEPICEERRKVITATHCIDCQSDLEKSRF